MDNVNSLDLLHEENNKLSRDLIIRLLLNSYNTNDNYSYDLEFIFELEKLFNIKSDSYFYIEATDRINKILSELNI